MNLKQWCCLSVSYNTSEAVLCIIGMITINANELITMHNDLADSVNVVLEVFARADDEVFADLVESLGGDRLEGPAHHRVVFQHRVELVNNWSTSGQGVELVNRQREQTTV